MKKINWESVKKRAKENEAISNQERIWTNRIVKYIVLSLLVLILIAGIGGFLFIRHSLSAMDTNQTATQEVTIPIGSTTRDIARILKENGLIHDESIFSFYLKSKSSKGLQAGYYDLSPAMSADELIAQLESGGRPIVVDADTKITVIEGMTIEQIAKTVAEHTPITEEDFLSTVKDESFYAELKTKFSRLLDPLADIEGLKYRLEGYLFPATYDYLAGMRAKELIIQMVGKTNLEYQKLRESGELENTWLSFHQVLTLASIVEKEGIIPEDRKLIAGVFFNRLDAEMPLQSDITVLYALGVHKELVTYQDLEVDSPYNLYMHTGLAPGPFNSPSLESVEAVLNPTYSEYYYFVADLDTQKVYYSSTIEEHDALVAQYVNKESNVSSSQSESEQEAEDEATEE